MENKTVETGSIGFTGLLQLAFIVLKLANIISWKWWQVLLPTIIGAAIIVLVILGAVIVGLAAYIYERHRKRKFSKYLKGDK